MEVKLHLEAKVLFFAGIIKGLQRIFHVNRICITLGGNVSICNFFVTLKFKTFIQIFAYNCEQKSMKCLRIH